jgi:tetratricopeptide (TPR) repeat protein
MRMRFLMFATLLTFASLAPAAWTPPANPNPQAILNEAQADIRARHYEDALAKLSCFHENALKYDQGQTGVRLSFALSAFDQLARVYPPAQEKMKAYRDAAEKDLLSGNASGKASDPLGAFRKASPFMDFAALNRHLKETTKTVELFKRLDREKPDLADSSFAAAQSELIAAREYKLCGKYMKGESSYDRLVSMYHMNKDMARNPAMGASLGEYAEKSFSNGVATLVGVLVQNNRKDEAQKIADKALKEKTDATFKALINKSLAGEVPTPWP